MDGHADIPPSHSGLSQYPRANPFGDESSNRATMPPPSGSSLPPFPPTGQPFQFGSQNFIPAGSSPSQWMLSQVPHTMLESSSVGSGSSQPASVFSGLFNADQLKSTPFFVSVSMDGHAGIPPSYSGLSQYPRANPFGDESSNRATMPPPSGSSLPPFQPCPQIPPTGQPSQYGSSPSWSTLPQPSSSLLSFPPLSPSSFLDFPSATVANKEMAYPPVPYTGGSGSSLPSSVFSVQPPYRGFPSATVANNDMALPPIAYMMPNSSSAEGSKAHKRASSDSISAGAGNRVGAPPPIPSYSQIPATLQLKHSRSTSQPSSFFSFDSLPPLNPSPVSVDERNAAGFSPSLPPSPFTMCHSSSRILGGGGDGENLPPRKSHRRSNSDVTFGFSSVMSPPLIPSRSLERSVSGGEVASDWSNLVKEEPGEGGGRKKSESEAMDDVFRAYMNLDNIDVLNSFGGNETVDSSGTRKSSSDSEGESSAKVSSGVKRRAGGDIAPTGRHCRSVSMDSGFMGKLDFGGDEKLPVKASPTNSGEGNSSVEFGNSEFTAAEMKKISADEKLAEIVMADPKRVKR
ncbi:unnamed protein product [Brassica rapa subsp. narinosa]